MPKLPDYRDVRAAAPRSTSRVFRKDEFYSEAEFAGKAKMGQTINKLGMAVQALGIERQEEADTMDALRAEAEADKLLTEHMRTYETDPNFKNYDKTFGVASKAIREQVLGKVRSPKLREKLALRLEGKFVDKQDALIRRAEQGINEERAIDLEDNVIQSYRSQYLDPKATPEIREKSRTELLDSIALAKEQGIISSAKARDLRKRYGDELAIEDLKRRGIEEPEKALEDLELLGDGPIDDEVDVPDIGDLQFKDPPLTRKVGEPRQSKVRGMIMHTTEGSDNMVGNGSWSNKKNTGANYYIAKDGTIFTWAPDDVKMNHAGTARNGKRMDLTNDSTIGVEIMVRPGEKPNAKQIAAARKLAAIKGQQYGFDPSQDIYGHGELTKSNHRAPTEAMDAVNAIRDGKMSKDIAATSEEGAPVDMKNRGITSMGRVKVASADTGTKNDASGSVEVSVDDPRKAQIKLRYGTLDPLQRAEAKAELRRAVKVKEEYERGTMKKAMEDDVASIRKTGVGVQGFDRDKAEKLLGKDVQWTEYNDSRERAGLFHEFARDLKDVNPDEMRERLANKKLNPEPGVSGFANIEKAKKEIQEEWRKEQDLRDKDPAKAVETSEEVEVARAALERMKQTQTIDGGTVDARAMFPGNEMENVIRARLDAQAKRGIAERNRKTLTEEEALALVPELEGKDMVKEFKAITQKAQETYGPYAEQAVRDGFSFRYGKGNKAAGEALFGAMESLRREGKLKISDKRKFMDAFDAGPADRFMAVTEEVQAPPSPLGLLSENAPAIAGAGPNKAQSDWLRADPARRAKVIDLKFGAGTASRLLAQPIE